MVYEIFISPKKTYLHDYLVQIEVIESIGGTLWDPLEIIEANGGTPPLTYAQAENRSGNHLFEEKYSDQ